MRHILFGITQPLWCSTPIEMDCECGAQAVLSAMRSWLHGCLGAHMGRKWGKRRRKFYCLLFCCPMLACDMSRNEQTGFGMVGWLSICHFVTLVKLVSWRSLVFIYACDPLIHTRMPATNAICKLPMRRVKVWYHSTLCCAPSTWFEIRRWDFITLRTSLSRIPKPGGTIFRFIGDCIRKLMTQS